MYTEYINYIQRNLVHDREKESAICYIINCTYLSLANQWNGYRPELQHAGEWSQYIYIYIYKLSYIAFFFLFSYTVISVPSWISCLHSFHWAVKATCVLSVLPDSDTLLPQWRLWSSGPAWFILMMYSSLQLFALVTHFLLQWMFPHSYTKELHFSKTVCAPESCELLL